MASNLFGVSQYQKTSQAWTGAPKKAETPKAPSLPTKGGNEIKTKEWKPIDNAGPLVPKSDKDYGMTIGEAELSDKAKDYYAKLKEKFHNADFILVSPDMKDEVKKNATAYGNANKMVVLIGADEVEKMATDENFRKKYEGIIAGAQTQLLNAKNSLSSAGANIKNFGMSVDSNGNVSFFATLKKSGEAQKARLEKKAAEKKAEKAAEKKKAEKEEKAEKLDKAKEKGETDDIDNEDFITIEAGSFEELLSKVQTFTYENAAGSVLTEAEKAIGQSIDFKG